MKIAIVHDYLNQYGGAEKVIEALHEIYPEAPIYTSLYDKDKMPDSFKEMDIRTSFMQKLPFVKKHFKKYLPLYPRAFESFDLSEYDVVLSSSSAFAKSVKTGKNSCHIAYVNTPPRFIWFYDDYIKRENINRIYLKILHPILAYLKKKDIESSKGVDYFIANSENVRKRIRKFYNKDAEVIYPPVECSRFNVNPVRELRPLTVYADGGFKPSSALSSNNHRLKSVAFSNGVNGEDGNYYLVTSRLREYKRIDVAVKAFSELGLPLKIIGDGSDRIKLEKMAKDNIEFLGRVDDEELINYYKGCKAVVFCGEEDFGIVPVEAQSCGKPVIAYKAGGALETVRDNGDKKTGKFFYPQTKEALVDAVKNFNPSEYNPDVIRKHALEFDKEVFKKRIREFVDKKYGEFKESRI